MRFLAIAGDCIRPHMAGENLHRVFEAGNLTVFGDADLKVEPFEDLLVIGASYTSLPAGMNRSASSSAERQDCSFNRLLRLRWGTYVALRFTRLTGAIDLMASPSAMLPCYYVAAKDAVVVGSEAASVLRTSGTPIEIDWNQVALQLMRRDWRGRACGLKGLHEVQAGTISSIVGGNRSDSSLWTPSQWLRRKPDLGSNDSARSLKQAIEQSVGAMVKTSGRLLLGLSGGLDSSIVAAALTRSGADFDCFTMYSEGSDADERDFAKSVTDYLGLQLFECPYDVGDVNLEVSSVANIPRPIGWPFQQALDAACMRILSLQNANALIRGTGGDAIFCLLNSASAVLDALLDEGVTAAGLTLFDLSKLTGASFWQCLASAGRIAIRGRQPLLRVDQSFVASAVWKEVGHKQRHPWVADSHDLLPGRQRHIDMLTAQQNFIEARRALTPDVLLPLLSQPVIETALRIPTPAWIRGGINRAVAREAFADLLPESIISRKTKGGPDAFAASVFRKNHSLIREILLDGRLADQGILDRTELEAAMKERIGDVPKDFVRLLALVDAEAWITHWRGLAAA